MKKCPTCQKTYEDTLRFCQTDGTPLVEDAPPPDPYATMMASKEELMGAMPPKNEPPTAPTSSPVGDDDLLDIPDEGDMMKTAVVSEAERKSMFGDEFSKPIPPPSFGQDELENQKESSSADTLLAQPEPPKFSEPSLNPPNFGDFSSPSSSSGSSFGSSSDSPFGSSADTPRSPFENEPPMFDKQPLPSDFNQPKSNDNPFNPPIPSPFGEQMPPSYNQPTSSPFEPMDFKVEEAKAEALNTPFANEVSQGNQAMSEQNWTPPAPPQQNWGNQEIGQNTPFQPPPPTVGGQNQTLAIVSLVTGILSCLCCVSIITGPAALVMGFMAKGKATSDPQQYGGAGLALGGMITGAIGTLIGIAALILNFMGFFAQYGR